MNNSKEDMTWANYVGVFAIVCVAILATLPHFAEELKMDMAKHKIWMLAASWGIAGVTLLLIWGVLARDATKNMSLL